MKLLPFSKLMLLCSSLFFAGCGGGGGSTPPDPIDPPIDTNPEPVSLTVTAVDGYLKDARIYLDLNENYQFDETEPHAMSDEAGQVTFSLTDIAEGLQKPIVVEAIKGQTKDMSTGLLVNKSYSMVAPAGSVVVSPLTTLAQLSLVKGQHADITSAINEITTLLGLSQDANIMADYLGSENNNETLYAIARNVVQLLPQDPSTLFTGQTDSQTLFNTANNIATAIQDAIAAGEAPGTLWVTLNENGDAQATALTLEHARAFVQDVQVWSDAFTFDFIEAATDFGDKVQAASQLAQTDSKELLSLLARYSEAGLIALKANIYITADAGLIVSGSSGTVTTDKNDETGVESIVIDAEHEGRKVQATITLSQGESIKAMVMATLDSSTVTIVVSQGSELVLDNDTYVPTRLLLNTVINTKGDSDQLHFVGNAILDTVKLEKSSGDTITVLSEIGLSGLWQVAGNESFSAGVHMTLNSTLVDDALHIEVLNILLQLSADFTDVPDALMIFDVNLGGNGSLLSLTLAYGERFITLTFAPGDDATEIVVTNAMGMTLTLDLTLLRDESNRGILVMGIEQVGTIDKQDGHYILTFNDSSTVTLF